MSLFSRKKKIQLPEPNIAVETIPAEFLGGNNPVVQFKTITKIVEKSATQTPILTTVEKRAFDQKATVGSGGKNSFVNLLTSRKFIFIGFGILFLLFAAGASVYYFLPYFKARPAAQSMPPVLETVISVPEPVVEQNQIIEELPPTEPIVQPVILPVLPEAKMQFPSMLLGDSVDSDNDDITDMAEEIFATDPEVADTDRDKYPDGHEVYYLYNPAGKEPMRLIASGLVSEYSNPVFDYKLYYPNSWAVGNIDPNYRDVVFSTLTGENIEVRVFDLNPGQTLSDWIAVNAPTERLNDLVDFTTAFKFEGKRRIDDLVYYYTDSKRLYVFSYNTTDSNTINYRIVAKILARSFRLGSVKEELLITLPVESEVTAGVTPASTEAASSNETVTPTESMVTSNTSTESNNLESGIINL